MKTKASLLAVILILMPLIIIPIHTAHRVYHLSYTVVLYNLAVNRRFGPD